MKDFRLSVKNPSIFFSVLVCSVLLFSVFFKFGLAEDVVSRQGMEVSPPSQELKGDPGSSMTVRAKVRNKSSQTVNIRPRVEDFTAQGQEGQVALIDNGADSLANWTSLDTSVFSLKANESREITATINLPKSAAGGHYGSFVFAIEGVNAGPNSASVSQELASLFLIRVSGPVSEELIMTELSVPTFLEFGPVPLALKFKNTGNVHLKPFGLVNVRNIFGKTVGDVVVRGETNIFPGSQRLIRISLDEKFLIGPYTAQALINFGTKNESVSMTTTFFVFPVRIFVATLLIGFIIYKGRKRLRKSFKALFGK